MPLALALTSSPVLRAHQFSRVAARARFTQRMADAAEGPNDAITEDEMTGTVIPNKPYKRHASPTTPKNAFTELMSKKPHAPTPSRPAAASSPSSSARTVFSGRDGLGAYTADPAAFPPSRVIYHTDTSVLHPFDALADPAFRASVLAETQKVRGLLARELRRRYARFSALDRARCAALDADGPPTPAAALPPGRDWAADIISGIHAHPSMAHLHVHVLSRDMHSPCMRHPRHYESFNSPFLVPVEDFPLAPDDPRRHPARSGFLDRDLKCWRCGKNFGRAFKRLKEHLEEEFEAWKRV
ncbi:aprataxin-like protein [Cryomyces antarcticus]|nr:aprataxin-like protein [Cryomyces antarcticus]